MGILGNSMGCNHLFYYPTAELYATPHELGLVYDDDWLTQPNGEKVHLWHLRPKPGAQDRKTVVVHFHGNAQNMSSHFLYVGWLAQEGFAVVTFDYRGYGRSDGVPTRGGTIEDGRAVLERVLMDPRYAGHSIVVIGQSLGGAVSIPAVAATLAARPELSGRLRGVVIEAGFDSYRGIGRSKLGGFWLTWPLQYPLTWLLLDGDYDALDAVDEIAAPMLFLYARGDPIIPHACGQRLLAAAAACTDKQLWTIESDGHIVAFAEESSPYRSKLLQWLEQRL